jgi:hypothetical protein
MRSSLLVVLAFVASPALAAPPDPYVPAPAKDIPGYSETPLPCVVKRGVMNSAGVVIVPQYAELEENDFVICKQPYASLKHKPLRELSILRNTIYARYGWAGFRKAWLREHFQAQPWYKPDPNFSFDRLSYVDRENAELFAKIELSLRYEDLEYRREAILAKAGKWWGDLPSYEDVDGKKVYACSMRDYGGPPNWTKSEEIQEKARESKDCRHHRGGPHGDEVKGRQSNAPAEPDLHRLAPEDRIELGLISRAMGEFAVDDGQREQVSRSLDTVLSVKELRLLSLRDLRFLRNTIFARRGRSFKSELLQKHFQNMPWYKPDPAYTDARLTATDKRNIELIRSVEDELGGALGDKDFKRGNPSISPTIPYVDTQV